MHWLNDTHVMDVAIPSTVGTDTELQVDIGASGLGKAWENGVAEILSRKDGSGVYQVVDESTTIDQNGILRITEGSGLGFLVNHVYRVLLVAGNIQTPTVTSSAP